MGLRQTRHQRRTHPLSTPEETTFAISCMYLVVPERRMELNQVELVFVGVNITTVSIGEARHESGRRPAEVTRVVDHVETPAGGRGMKLAWNEWRYRLKDSVRYSPTIPPRLAFRRSDGLCVPSQTKRFRLLTTAYAGRSGNRSSDSSLPASVNYVTGRPASRSSRHLSLPIVVAETPAGSRDYSQSHRGRR